MSKRFGLGAAERVFNGYRRSAGRAISPSEVLLVHTALDAVDVKVTWPDEAASLRASLQANASECDSRAAKATADGAARAAELRVQATSTSVRLAASAAAKRSRAGTLTELLALTSKK